MKPNLKKLLERIYMGYIPTSLSIVDDEPTIEALKRQGVVIDYNSKFPEGVIKLNYVKLIQDIIEIKKDKKSETFEIDDIEEAKQDLGILMRAAYHGFIQDQNKGDDEKLFFTFFFRKYLLTYQQVYNIDVIDNQASFMRDLNSMEDYYYKVEKERLDAIEENVSKPFDLSNKWPYSKELLIRLSEELFNEGFINARFAFVGAFDSNYPGRCNWIKERTCLLFLLWLLIDKGSTEKPSDSVIDICCKMFIVRGKETTRKIAISTNIQNQIDSELSDLKGRFLHLQNMYQDLGFQ